MNFARQLAQPGKPSVWKGAFNFARLAASIVVLILAARQLDGWLATATWIMAGWNILIIVIAVGGLIRLGVEAVTREQRRAATRTEAHQPSRLTRRRR